MNAGLSDLLVATWPPAQTREIGGFVVPDADAGGRRVSAAFARGAWSEDGLEAVLAHFAAQSRPALFRVDDAQSDLARVLEARGLRAQAATAFFEEDAAPLAAIRPPPVTAFHIWPALAIHRQIWAASGIGPERQAVMARVTATRTALLGRCRDRAAAAGFAAIKGDAAMVHALCVLPAFRRSGMARHLMHEATFWATQHGAARIAVAVERANAPALALYAALGMGERGGYRYFAAQG